MAGFHTKTFTKHDDYMSPFIMWDNIKEYIHNDKILWESAFGDGQSGNYLKTLGFNVIHTKIDYFNETPENWDVQITNPPFTLKKQWFTRAKELNKPFIIVCPASMICTKYIRELFSDCEYPLQIIIPKKRIQFIKVHSLKDDDDNKIPEQMNKCNFDCFYYCWKMNLPNDIIWLR